MNLAETRTHIPILHVVNQRAKYRGPRRVSPKMASLKKEYMKLREKFLKDHPYCEYHMAIHPHADRVPFSTEIHHRRGRGRFLLDTTTWMACSAQGHKAIHNNPKLSYQMGWMQKRT